MREGGDVGLFAYHPKDIASADEIAGTLSDDVSVGVFRAYEHTVILAMETAFCKRACDERTFAANDETLEKHLAIAVFALGCGRNDFGAAACNE